jgi:pyridoxine 5-phosphate synthase
MPKLGVNIDHVATLRQARLAQEPNPLQAAIICQLAGSDSVVAHLREDRRHINDNDLKKLKKVVKVRLNLEMSCATEIVKIATEIRPDQVTLVPERRQEITTEGGLDLIKNKRKVEKIVKIMRRKGIITSLFIDPDTKQIKMAKKINPDFIELHTGKYANSKTKKERQKELDNLIEATALALSLNLKVNAGHGLDYHNVKPVAKIAGIEELNIGHSIISRAVFVGLAQAIKEMKSLIHD